MKIVFDLEGSDDCAFYALYAGLRMFKEYKSIGIPVGQMSLCSAENYCRLEEMKQRFPKQYAEAEAEYNERYMESNQPPARDKKIR